MIYRRCKCGKCESWESGMPPAPCQGCEECRTTMETSPGLHRTPLPHSLKAQFDVNTGKPSRPICSECLRAFRVEEAEALVASGRAAWLAAPGS